LLAEAEGAERLAAHLGMYRIGREVEVERLDLELISVIGPEARATLDLEALGPEHSHGPAVIAGVATVRALVTAPGVDLAVAPARAEELAAALTAAGIPEASERAAEILRVEAGRPRLGPEMGTETMPAEAGIVERAVSFTKGCYIGQEPVARLHYKGRPNRHLRGLRLEREARPGDAVQLDGRELGRIGTAALSPARGPVALAILRREAAPGSRVAVGEEGNAGEVVELPFGSA
jgi:folate-binding protein YgfZ